MIPGISSNLTGVSVIATEISSRRLQLLLELAPQVKTVAQIINGAILATNVPAVNEAAIAVRALGRQSFVVEARTAQDFETAFATLVERKADALFVTSDPLFTTNRAKLLALVDHRNTLIMVHRQQLLDQWLARLSAFLDIEADSIGIVRGGKIRPTGVIDIAIIQSLVRKGEVSDLVADYGHLIVDECHNLSAVGFETIARARLLPVTGPVYPNCKGGAAMTDTAATINQEMIDAYSGSTALRAAH